MRVGLDLDGVVYDFGSALRRWLVMEGWDFGFEGAKPPSRWEFYEDWGMTLDQFIDYTNRGVAAGYIFWQGLPMPNAREAVAQLVQDGHSIHVVTDRFFGPPGDAQAATVNWLSWYDIPFDSITFTKDKTIASVDAMVDDKLENYDALDAAGVRVYLLNQPWNQVPGGDDRRRVGTLFGFVDALKEAEVPA